MKIDFHCLFHCLTQRFFDLIYQKLLVEQLELQLALHVLDIVIKGTVNNTGILLDAYKLKVKILKRKAREETSFIAKNILNSSANQIKEKLKELRKSIH